MIIDSRNILDKMIMLIAGWWLSPIPLNNMSSSVGMMMTFPICGKKTFMFQTTNQVYIGPWF
jgi:hypothetical protein